LDYPWLLVSTKIKICMNLLAQGTTFLTDLLTELSGKDSAGRCGVSGMEYSWEAVSVPNWAHSAGTDQARVKEDTRSCLLRWN
jgi:hypothetical protein